MGEANGWLEARLKRIEATQRVVVEFMGAMQHGDNGDCPVCGHRKDWAHLPQHYDNCALAALLEVIDG